MTKVPFKTCFLEALFLLMTVSVPVFGSLQEMKINRLLVPINIVEGDNTVLKCEYDLGDESLYSVKFYKDDVEFYRYEPENRPAVMTFETRGVTIDEYLSEYGSVFLCNVTLESSGNYTCEVSTAEPPFHTKRITKDFVVQDSRHYAILKITKLDVPSHVVLGGDALLRCDYEEGNETMDILFFHKGVRNFYQYIPTEYPPIKTFNLSGVDVDVTKSGNGFVYLRNLTKESSDNYTCEIYTEKRYTEKTKPLQVVDAPLLTTEKYEYELGDNVSVRCNSGKSKPAPDIEWYINNQLAESHLFNKETILHPDKLESASLALSFKLKSDLLQNGKVTVKCVARVKEISAETSIEITASVSRYQNSIK